MEGELGPVPVPHQRLAGLQVIWFDIVMELNVPMNLTLYSTLQDGSTAVSNIPFAPDTREAENQVINLYPEITFQTLEGFGGAITDAAGYVYSLMNQEQKRQVIETYFSPDQMRYGLVRIHMDSCDFSTEMYEAMSDPSDRNLNSFSFARTERYILPMLADAQKAAGKPLKLMLSPWSPPAFMKTNSQRKLGGKLKPEYRDFWADYICRYIEEFQKRGYQVQRISLQNEPKAVQTWDSCIFTAEDEKVFLRDHLYPAMTAHGLKGVEVFIWDHNKERLYERVRDLVDERTKDMVAGAALHWYSGDHFEAMDLVRRQYPDLKLITSESCIEYRFYSAEDEVSNTAKLAHELIGDLNHGICAFYDWNLLLDETGGPNHVGNFCYAAFMYDRQTGSLMTRLLQKVYYHFSHYIAAGAKRIGLSRYTDSIELTAFQNPDGGLVLVAYNQSGSAAPVKLRLHGQIASFTVEPGAMITGRINANN